MADATDSKSVGGNPMRVRLSPRALPASEQRSREPSTVELRLEESAMNVKWLRVFVILVGSAACSDRLPTATRNLLGASFSTQRQAPSERAALLRNVPVSTSSFSGSLTITRIAYDEASGQLLFSGTITRSSDGATASFKDAPGALSRSDRS